MATITSTATGNFSAGATWVGGVAPGTGDDAVVATGHTVTIDTNTTVLSIQSSGGKFTISNGVTLTCTATNGVKGPSAGSNPTLDCTLTTGNSATVVANVAGSTAVGVAAVTVSSTGTLNVTGTVTGGSVTSAHGLRVSGAGRCNITGNVTAGSGQTAMGVDTTSACRVDITGNVTGGGGTDAWGFAQTVAAAITLNVTGNVIAGTGTTAYGINAGTNVGHVIDITGTLTATTALPALITGAIYTVAPIISGNVIDASNGVRAARVFSVKFRPTTNGNYTDHLHSDGTTRYLRADSTYWAAGTDGLSPANVRYGTLYGTSNSLTGTCRVPAAASVLYGVPVDNTTGTASLTNDPQLTPL